MTESKPKVVVAMSGGVDSSVAACLLHEQGYDVTGLFMRVGVEAPPVADDNPRNHQGCCSASDAADARYVAGKLDIPFFALNFQKDFDELIDYFADEYARARTPNPCVMCNQKLKFGKLLDYADAVGARCVATGHYARVESRDGRRVLRRAADPRKDQSYVLFGIAPDVLERVLFPIGHLTKDQVRDHARRLGLPVCDKPDSVEICFVPDRDYARVVKQRRPDAFRPGDVVDDAGRVVGRHPGVPHFTVGQRRGLGIAAGVPIYVTRVDAESNTLTVGHRDRLLKPALIASGVRMLDPRIGASFRADVKIRYLHTPAPAEATRTGPQSCHVRFDQPQSAPTPGQAVVFYDGDIVIGGGWITAALDVPDIDDIDPVQPQSDQPARCGPR